MSPQRRGQAKLSPHSQYWAFHINWKTNPLFMFSGVKVTDPHAKSTNLSVELAPMMLMEGDMGRLATSDEKDKELSSFATIHSQDRREGSISPDSEVYPMLEMIRYYLLTATLRLTLLVPRQLHGPPQIQPSTGEWFAQGCSGATEVDRLRAKLVATKNKFSTIYWIPMDIIKFWSLIPVSKNRDQPDARPTCDTSGQGQELKATAPNSHDTKMKFIGITQAAKPQHMTLPEWVGRYICNILDNIIPGAINMGLSPS
ncbi:hypothetical protein BDK51DRAFT_35169 [Blyttiomyces helicus]|uniref:Uncharacterized protein n=1 Tax=Blyttiomyces helicus TaxID=388810 RepID=A0A4P9WQF9_9FUNG|nr:hypothetical protein BDK51DRAFT_35169 [Blyttiomyces helicus]|eukprot:RKO94403.1 hypothetical protein BDK51DRAFT_35169 [Blyttiomyces helicus]